MVVLCVNISQGNFKWNAEEWTSDKIFNLKDDAEKVFFYVHLHYPIKMHDLNNGYALGEDNQTIKTDMFNASQQVGYIMNHQ